MRDPTAVAASRKRRTPSSSAPLVVGQNGGDDPRGPVGRGGDHPPTGGVLLVDGQGEQVHPVHAAQRVGHGEGGGRPGGLGEQPLVQRLGPTPHPQSPGKRALSSHTGLNAGVHGVAQAVEIGEHLLARPGGDLIGHDHLRDATPLARADRQKVGTRREGVGRRRGVHFSRGRSRQGTDRRRAWSPDVLHDEAAAHRVVRATQHLTAGGAVGGDGQRVRVVRQNPPGQEEDVRGRVEGQRPDAVDHELSGRGHLLVQALAYLRRDGLGLVAGQAHDDGAIGGVTATGRPQRAVELDGQAGDGRSAPSMVMLVRARRDGDDVGQRTGEGAPGPHGSDRMG